MGGRFLDLELRSNSQGTPLAFPFPLALSAGDLGCPFAVFETDHGESADYRSEDEDEERPLPGGPVSNERDDRDRDECEHETQGCLEGQGGSSDVVRNDLGDDR